MKSTEYLGSKRVNIELILWINDKNILHYGIRLRPWKQETRIGVMILTQGLSVENALDHAARLLFKEAWEVLDYAARPWLDRTAVPAQSQNPSDFDFLASELPQVANTPIDISNHPPKVK